MDPAHAGGTCPARPADQNVAKRLASRWWRQAVEHFKAGRDIEAILAWRCAHRLVPHPLTLYNIGRAAERAGKVVLAIRSYEEYLKTLTSTASRVKAEVEAAIRRLKSRLPASEKPVTDVPKQRRARPLPRPEDEASEHGKEIKRPRRSSALAIAGWTTIGTGVGFAVLAGVLGGMANREKRFVENADADTYWKPGLDRRADAFERYRTSAWVMASLGAASLITGTALVIVRYYRRKQERMTVNPVALPKGAGLCIDGRF